jgi:hypothetical protein
MEIKSTSEKNSPDVSKQRPNSLYLSRSVSLLLSLAVLTGTAHPQASKWNYSLTLDGYIVPGDVAYATPIVIAQRDSLHLEARYNYEDLNTGSVWVGYRWRYKAPHNVEFEVIPMIGGMAGRTNGVAPGCELGISYRRFELYFVNEYVFDFNHRSNNFYFAWPQLSYSVLDWLKVGAVAQQTQTYQTSLDIQRGLLVTLTRTMPRTRKTVSFTTYILNPGVSTTTVLETSFDF